MEQDWLSLGIFGIDEIELVGVGIAKFENDIVAIAGFRHRHEQMAQMLWSLKD